MSRGVYSAILLALAAEGHGQFLRSWSGGASYSSSGRFSSWISNFAKSSTGARDQHGRMHHQVQESHAKSMSSDDGIQHVAAQASCKDGLCKGETVHAVQAAPTSSMGWPQRMPAGLQAMLEDLVDSPRLMEPRPKASPPLPFRTGIVVPLKQPMFVVQLRPVLRGSRPLALTDGETQPSPVARVAPRGHHHDPNIMGHMAVMMAGVYCALAVSILTTVLLFSRRCAGKAEARELPIRSLAEPLAPVEEAAALPAAAARQVVAPAKTPLQQYLLDVYSRAQERAC